MAEPGRNLRHRSVSATGMPALLRCQEIRVAEPWRSVSWLLGGLLAALTMGHSSGRLPARAPDALGDLVAAAPQIRPFRGRLTGGFTFAPYRGADRGETAITPPVDLRLAAARLEKRLDEARTASNLAAFAAGALFMGEPSAAIDALSAARRIDASSARLASDLAAAYLSRAETRSRGESVDSVRALDAAILANELDPALAEGWFNRASALEAMLPDTLAHDAWIDYLRIDDRSPWATEARSRASASAVTPAASAASFTDLSAGELSSAVTRDPQRAREALLETILPAWGSAVLAGHAPAAGEALERAHAIAAALVGTTSDPSSLDAVADARRGGRSLAAAYVAYGAGMAAYRAEDLKAAERFFHTAAAAPTRSLSVWAGLQLATIAVDRRRIVEAEAAIQELTRRTVPNSYRAARARARWLRGLVEHQSNRIDAALVSYDAAASLFATLGERENELAVKNAAADNLRLRGERQRSWRLLLEVLARTDQISRPLRRYSTFFNAALFAADEGLMRASLVLQDEAIREARRASPDGVLVEALTTKARLTLRAGKLDRAHIALSEARGALDRLGRDQYLEAAIAAAAGEIAADPVEAEKTLSHALAYFTTAEPAICARLWLLRGRARLARGDQTGGAADFIMAIEDIERRRAGIQSSALRISYLDDASEVFADMIALQLRQRNGEAAFSYAERGLARAFLDASHAPLVPLAEVQRSLDAETVLIEYKQLASELVCWVVTSTAFEVVQIPLGAEPLDRRIDRVRHSLEQAGGPRGAGRELYDLLIAPAAGHLRMARTIVIAGDGAVPRLPFAALESPAGRYLVEDVAISLVPSAAAFVALTARQPHDASAPDRALIISDPDVSVALFGTLPRLPGAQAEARAVATLYTNARVLHGSDAIKRTVLRELRDAAVVHVAGHAVDNPERPELSALVLTPELPERPDSAALRAQEISMLRLPRSRLVVLAACDTAEGAVSRSEGPLGLARAFLHAGTSAVVAALWKIEDTASAELFRRFHRHYLRSRRPAEALRSAQLEMLHSADPSFAHPMAWSAIVSIGALGPHRSVIAHQ